MWKNHDSEINQWVIDNIEQGDYSWSINLEFRHQEDMNLFMLSWVGRCKVEIIVNETKCEK